MGLTDTAFFVVLLAATILVFVATVAFVPRLVGAWWAVLARAVLILLVAVLVLVTTAVRFNAMNGWYTSWSDLGGADSTSHTVVTGAGAGQAAADGAVAPSTPPPANLPALPEPGKRLQTYTVTGKASGVTAKVLVLLPADYEQPQAASTSYPVIQAMHGYPGTPSGWTGAMSLGDQLDTAVSGRKVADSIVVVPELNSPVSADGECVDAPGGPKLETWLTTDVPEFARTHLRVRTDRASWAAMGYSAGGWCSAMAGVLHPDRYSASIVMGGYFAPSFSGSSPLRAGSAQAKRYDLTAAIQAKAPALAMWIQAGTQSEFWPQTQAFLAAVRAPMSATTVIQPTSGHRFDVWKAEVPDALAWLGSNVPGFKPAG